MHDRVTGGEVATRVLEMRTDAAQPRSGASSRPAARRCDSVPRSPMAGQRAAGWKRHGAQSGTSRGAVLRRPLVNRFIGTSPKHEEVHAGWGAHVAHGS